MSPRPLPLRLAVSAILVSLLVLVTSDYAAGEVAVSRVFAHIAVSALVGFLCFQMWRGHAGAVVTYLVLEGISVVFEVRNGAFPYSSDKLATANVLEWLTLALSVMTLVGLLHPSTRRWLSEMAKAREEFARSRRMAHIRSGSRFR